MSIKQNRFRHVSHLPWTDAQVRRMYVAASRIYDAPTRELVNGTYLLRVPAAVYLELEAAWHDMVMGSLDEGGEFDGLRLRREMSP